MVEARAIRLGEALGHIILNYSESMGDEQREFYLREVKKGIEALKYRERKRGEPLAKEHRRPLEGLDLDRLEIENPNSVLLILDEIMQITYSAQRAREIQKGILSILV